METTKPDYTRLILPDVMTPETLAERLGLSSRHVANLIRRGQLPGRKVGRHWLVLRSELLVALQSNAKPERGT